LPVASGQLPVLTASFFDEGWGFCWEPEPATGNGLSEIHHSLTRGKHSRNIANIHFMQNLALQEPCL
jgi:hypothetical protein